MPRPRQDTTGPDLSRLPAETVSKLLTVSRRLAESGDLESVLQLVIDALRDLLRAERATVFEYDGNTDELFTAVAHGIGDGTKASVLDGAPPPPTVIRIPAQRGIAGAAATSLQVVNIPDAYADERFNRSVDLATGFRTRTILAIPLIDHERNLVGVAQVLNKVDGAFDRADEIVAEGLAANAAVAIKRGRLMEDRLARDRMERDLLVARTIQQQTFPSDLPTISGFDIAATSVPADQCGGDAYDVLALRSGEVARPDEAPDAVQLLLADATGHGIGAALSSMQTRGMVRLGVRLGQSLARIAEETNGQLCEDLPGGRFVTAWLARIEPATGAVESFSAGQGPLLIYRRAADTFEVLATDGPPFGVFEWDDPVTVTSLTLDSGDMVLALTDGFYEAESPEGRQFGQEGVEAIVRSMANSSADALLRAIGDAVLEHTHHGPPADDRTGIILIRQPS
ncbi:MAG: SpoIIE family protein phosphatase [Phycisphaeraceae bacterium]|nr:SpoIIE family protein phosphatase [Phycisphaeraceae bacterium]